jgi:DNA mismatch endonuclease, patch repair protein
MADFMSKSERSAHMSKIRSKDTKPDFWVRRSVHALGYRFRLHDKKLPGRPDLVFASRRKVIFVNGCFWHGHECAVGSRLPKTNTDFWAEKRTRNQQRDASQRQMLVDAGWNYFDVWECQVASSQGLLGELQSFLDN